MKKFLALFLALLCVFCFAGCDKPEELTDHQKIAQYIQENGGSITIEHNSWGTVTITNPSDIIRIECDNPGTISSTSSLDLKENEDYFNYEGSYYYSSYSSFTVKGTIKADVYDAWTALTYNTATGSGYTDSTSLRIINNTMNNALYLAKLNIQSATNVNIYELYGFDALV